MSLVVVIFWSREFKTDCTDRIVSAAQWLYGVLLANLWKRIDVFYFHYIRTRTKNLINFNLNTLTKLDWFQERARAELLQCFQSISRRSCTAQDIGVAGEQSLQAVEEFVACWNHFASWQQVSRSGRDCRIVSSWWRKWRGCWVVSDRSPGSHSVRVLVVQLLINNFM